MSWSFSCIGKPENVAKALDKYGESLSGYSKDEFFEAKPHLIALVQQNFTSPEYVAEPLVEFDASGSGSLKDGKKVYGSVYVSIKGIHKPLV